MSARDTRKTGLGDNRGDKQTSVVGSRVSDTTSTGLFSRRLPRGGIKGSDDLKVSDSLDESGFISSGRNGKKGRSVLRIIAIVSGTLIVVLLALAAGAFALSNTSAFEIKSVQSYDTDHITADSVAALVELPQGATLLNIDEAEIQNQVMKNPWVESVVVERNFPDTLRIICKERTPAFLVSMGTGGIAWLLASDGRWIEPMRIDVPANESMADAALAKAVELSIKLIMDVPGTVSPSQGAMATDEAIKAVWAYKERLSPSFMGEVVAISASSEDDISCILKNGVEVSFGTTSGIENKERVAKEILDSYAGQVTYINVRVPSHPTYRRVNSDYVREGTGATGSAVDETPLFGNKEEEAAEGEEGQEQAEGTEASENSGETTSDGSGYPAESTYDEGNSEYGYDESYGSGYDDSGSGYDDYGYGYDDYSYDESYGYDDSNGYGYDEYGYDESYGY